MSLGDADAKFPGQLDKNNNIPPSPSRENPGAVFPKSDPQGAPPESIPGTGGEEEPSVQNTLSNPYVLEDALEKLDRALANAVSTITSEEGSLGVSGEAETLTRKFNGWREELRELVKGRKKVAQPSATAGPTKGGGMFTD